MFIFQPAKKMNVEFLFLFLFGFDRLSVKRKGAGADKAAKKTAKKGKPAKDPNKPKRPASAFFVFM